MIIQGKEFKIYEIYSQIAVNKTHGDLDIANFIEEELIKQNIDFSRIAFKEYRDELVAIHKGYAVKDHQGLIVSDLFKDGIPDPNKLLYGDTVVNQQVEKHFCRQMYCIDRLNHEGHVDSKIGRIVDYEIPIKRCKTGTSSDIKIGCIDLITETENSVYLVEAKMMNSNESLLRAVFEIITYSNMISRKQLLAEFSVTTTNKFKYYHSKNDLKLAIMIFEGSKAHKDYIALKDDGFISCLIKKYKIEFFVLESKEEYGQYILK